MTERRRAALALLAVAPAATVGTVLALILFRDTTVGKVSYAACKAWLYGLPLVWHLVVDRQPVSGSPPRKGGFGVAAALGVAIGVVILAAYYTVGVRLMDLDEVARLGREVIGDRGDFVVFALYICLVNALLEEYVFRWFLFRKCEVLLERGWPAVLLSAAIFTTHHVFALKLYMNWPLTLLCSAGVLIGGVTWSWLYLRYRSVWTCYVSHAIVDVAIFWVVWVVVYGG